MIHHLQSVQAAFQSSVQSVPGYLIFFFHRTPNQQLANLIEAEISNLLYWREGLEQIPFFIHFTVPESKIEGGSTTPPQWGAHKVSLLMLCTRDVQ